MVQQSSYAVPRADLGEAISEYEGANADMFVGTGILPVLDVVRKDGTLPRIPRENTKRSTATHANGGNFNRVTMSAEDLTYNCLDYGLEAQLTDTDRQHYRFDFDAELETAEVIKRQILIERETRIKDLVWNTSTWTGAALFTDVSAAPWDAAASDAIAHVLAAKEKVRSGSGFEADSMMISAATLNNLLGNTGIKNRFPGAPLITEADIRRNIASIFGLANLFVGKATYDSAKEGQTYTGADVWPDDYCSIFKLHRGGLKGGGLGRFIKWTDIDEEPDQVTMYREEQTASDIFRVRDFADELIFDVQSQHLLQVD
jgi:hypothetical protein